MKPIPITIGLTALATLAFVVNVESDGGGGFFDLSEAIPRVAIATVFVVALFGCIVSLPLAARSKGYNWALALAVTLLAIATGLLSHIPGLLLITVLITALPKVTASRALFHGSLLVLLAIAATFVALHTHGYRVWGLPYMVRGAPQMVEGWVQVIDIRNPGEFVLADGSVADLGPFEFAEELSTSDRDAFSMRFFNVSFRDLYLKRAGSATSSTWWIVRMGNEFACALPGFFPNRVYGYYEWDLIKCLSEGRIGYATPSPREVPLALTPPLRERILRNLQSESDEWIGGLRAYATESYDFAHFSGYKVPVATEKGEWSGLIVMRKSRASSDWSEAEVYSIPEVTGIGGLENSSEEQWDRMLQADFQRLSN